MVNPETTAQTRYKSCRNAPESILCLFLFLAGSFLLCMVQTQTAKADSRTGAEERKESAGSGPSTSNPASPQPAGTSGAGGDSSEPAAASSPQPQPGTTPAATDQSKRTE